jgi:AcrR family transcriptional regulator
MDKAAPRKRNAAATQEAILVAARRAFTAHGYGGAGLREIATLAGVNVALINRYFGSKDGLFKAAIIDHLDLEALFDGDISNFGKRITEYFMSAPTKKEGYDPTLAILRSTSSERSVAVITQALEVGFSDVLAAKLTHESPAACQAKSGMLVSILLGYDMMRRVFRLRALGSEYDAEVGVVLATTLQSVIDTKI